MLHSLETGEEGIRVDRRGYEVAETPCEMEIKERGIRGYRVLLRFRDRVRVRVRLRIEIRVRTYGYGWG